MQQSRFGRRYYLVYLFITLVGTLLFLINARSLSGIYGLLLISILLMIAPALFYIFCEKCSLSRGQSLSLLLIPLFALQYIYYLQAGVPVGFTDPHDHIFTYWKLFSGAGKILFENVQQISINFVGLYVLFRALSLASSLDIVPLAAVIPPFLNMLIITVVYLVVNRLHEHRTGLLAAMLYGWNHIVHILGQEFRTQTMGVLILFMITALLLIINKKTARSGVFASVILLAGLVTTSFVCNCYAFLVFTAVACVVFTWFLLKRDLDWLVINAISIGLYIAFLAFYAVYLLYVSKGFEPLLAQFTHVLFNAAGQAMAPELGNIITKSFLLILVSAAAMIVIVVIDKLIKKATELPGLGSFCLSCLTAGLLCSLAFVFLNYAGKPPVAVAAGIFNYFGQIMTLVQTQAAAYSFVYSKFVTFGTYLIWGLLWIAYICYFCAAMINRSKNTKLFVFFIGYSVLLAYCLINWLNSPLNPGRPYVTALILLVAAAAYFLYNAPGIIKFRPGQVVIKAVAVCLILCVISVNVAKKPDYIIGNKLPFQEVTGLEDGVVYWHCDQGQHLASDFIASTASDRNVFACTLMQRYPFLITACENNLIPFHGIEVPVKSLKNYKGSLVLLQDKINGKTFYERNALPDMEELDQTVQMMKIYTNDDYCLYEVQK